MKYKGICISSAPGRKASGDRAVWSQVKSRFMKTTSF